jgi:hypothetical protein
LLLAGALGRASRSLARVRLARPAAEIRQRRLRFRFEVASRSTTVASSGGSGTLSANVRPVPGHSNETAWAKNRRAVTIVVGGVAGT